MHDQATTDAARHDRDRDSRPRRRLVALRAAALAGALVSAGLTGAEVLAGGSEPIDTVQSGGAWPMGSTCCTEDPS